MHVAFFAMGADTAGSYYGMTKAIRSLGDPRFTARSMVKSTNYIQYPRDMLWTDANARREWERADVVILNQSFKALRFFPVRHQGVVVYHRGSVYRDNFAAHNALAESYGALTAVSTLDLLQYAPPDAVWIPGAVDTHTMAIRASEGRTRPPVATSGVVRVGHAPTSRAVKDTRTWLSAMNRLKRYDGPVEQDLIERVPWHECLDRKQELDIYYDQVQLGYGMNAIECMAMGIPVVAGTVDPFTQQKMLETFGEYPFRFAAPNTIYKGLRKLVRSEELRAHHRNAGLEHVRKYHSYEAVAQRIRNLCEMVLERR